MPCCMYLRRSITLGNPTSFVTTMKPGTYGGTMSARVQSYFPNGYGYSECRKPEMVRYQVVLDNDFQVDGTARPIRGVDHFDWPVEEHVRVVLHFRRTSVEGKTGLKLVRIELGDAGIGTVTPLPTGGAE
jgi:hypothetical protein